ncbi:hypothetical protein HCI99_17055 [Listeria booriae]|uniref:Uncharacterized protein n=1 Tax=Listeria booriae TaxID=1552123 RepID=A0A7X0XH03_9LIST|nr:hypothetical protein [Listeria booriae]MBC1493526.1 hypothetical protein [Listeria booriae]
MTEGLVRDFSELEKTKLKNIISQHNQDCKNTPCPQPGFPPDLNIDNYLQDIDNYHKQILLYSDIDTVKEVENIFDEVYEIDKTYANKANEHYEEINQIIQTLNGLSEMLGVQTGARYLDSSSSVFFQKLDECGAGAIDEELDKLVTINADGSKTYHWYKITELLSKDPAKASTWDYLILSQLVMGMSKIDENGVVTVDTVSLETFMSCGYELYGDGISTANNHRMTPLFKDFIEAYSGGVNLLLQERGNIFFEDGREIEQSKLQAELFKGSIFNYFLNNGECYLYVGWDKYDDDFPFAIDYSEDVNKNGLREINIGFESWENERYHEDYTFMEQIHPFDKSLVSELESNEEKAIESLRLSMPGEVTNTVGSLAIAKLLGYFPVTDIANAGLTVVETIATVNETNKKVDETTYINRIRRIYGALSIGGGVGEDLHNKEYHIDYLYQNETGLESKFSEFLVYRQELSSSQTFNTSTYTNLNEDAARYIETGEHTDLLTEYLGWYDEVYKR